MGTTKSLRQRSLANPPIVEMVLDIDCDLPASFDLHAAAPAARAAFAEQYPVETKQYAEGFLIEPREDGTQVSRSEREMQAYRFHREDRTQLVQVRNAGYSFNRLAPYQGFDGLSPEIVRTWNIYRTRFLPIAIRRTSLRFINRILVPHEDQRVELQHYFRTGPRLATKGLIGTGFLLQNTATDAETKFDVVTVLASHAFASLTHFAFLLDITVASDVSISVDEDAPLLWQTLVRLRELKNEVFSNTVTKKCLQLFR